MYGLGYALVGAELLRRRGASVRSTILVTESDEALAPLAAPHNIDVIEIGNRSAEP